jgi:hypothetical protein
MHRITRGRALLGVLGIALAGADAATVQVTDPPAAQARGELDESAGTGHGDPTPPLVAAGAGALVLVGAGGAAAWARRRRPRPGPGGRRDVVASAASDATGPVYEVVWRHDGRRACFELARLDGDGDDEDASVLPRSRASTWRVEGRPPAVTSLRLDLAELSTLLRDSGWRPAGSGDAWYALRFRAPTRSSHPGPVGARRRS